MTIRFEVKKMKKIKDLVKRFLDWFEGTGNELDHLMIRVSKEHQ